MSWPRYPDGPKSDSGRRPWWENDAATAEAMHRRQLLVKLHLDSSAALKASPNGRKLAVARCGEQGCGLKLATVTATRMGPVYLAWLAWKALSLPLVSDEDRLIVALAAQTDPDVLGASLLAIQKTQEDRYRKERKPSLVLELLNHPVPVALREPLRVRCKNHPATWEVDRERLAAAIRAAGPTGKPAKLLFPDRVRH